MWEQQLQVWFSGSIDEYDGKRIVEAAGGQGSMARGQGRHRCGSAVMSRLL